MYVWTDKVEIKFKVSLMVFCTCRVKFFNHQGALVSTVTIPGNRVTNPSIIKPSDLPQCILSTRFKYIWCLMKYASLITIRSYREPKMLKKFTKRSVSQGHCPDLRPSSSSSSSPSSSLSSSLTFPGSGHRLDLGPQWQEDFHRNWVTGFWFIS